LALGLHAVLLALWVTSAILTRGSSVREHGVVLTVVAICCAVVMSGYRENVRLRELRDEAATRPVSSLEPEAHQPDGRRPPACEPGGIGGHCQSMAGVVIGGYQILMLSTV
jgi:hypothetical protein